MNPVSKVILIVAAILVGIMVVAIAIGTTLLFISPKKVIGITNYFTPPRKLTAETSPDGKYTAEIFFKYITEHKCITKAYVKRNSQSAEIMTRNEKGFGYGDIAWSPDSKKVAVTTATSNNFSYIKVFDVSKRISADRQCNNMLLGPATQDVYPRWKDNSTVAVIVKGIINGKPGEQVLDTFDVSDSGSALVISKHSSPVLNRSAK